MPQAKAWGEDFASETNRPRHEDSEEDLDRSTIHSVRQVRGRREASPSCRSFRKQYPVTWPQVLALQFLHLATHARARGPSRSWSWSCDSAEATRGSSPVPRESWACRASANVSRGSRPLSILSWGQRRRERGGCRFQESCIWFDLSNAVSCVRAFPIDPRDCQRQPFNELLARQFRLSRECMVESAWLYSRGAWNLEPGLESGRATWDSDLRGLEDLASFCKSVIVSLMRVYNVLVGSRQGSVDICRSSSTEIAPFFS